MKNTKKRPASKNQPGTSKILNLDDITLPAQRQRLLEWLKHSPITTIEARSILNILAPAARIFELRHNLDFNIITTWIADFDVEGRKHRIGKYFLLPGKWSKRRNNNVKP